MRRILSLLSPVLAGSAVLASLLAVVPAAAQPARGLIVTLRSNDAAAGTGRDQPRQLRERVQAVAQDAALELRGQSQLSRNHHLLRFGRPLEGAALDAALRRVRLHPDVAYAEPDVLLKPAATLPNDTDFVGGRQDHLKGPASFVAGVNLPLAWDRTTGNANGIVAVLDTGIRADHPDLAGRLLPGYDFVSEVEYANDGDGRDADPSDPGDWVSSADRSTQPALFGACAVANSTWHGTFIAGQIAAASNNGLGVAGVNWGNQVLPLRVSGKCGAFLSDILDAMRWAAGLHVDGVPDNPNRARVINLSFGGDVACTPSYQTVIDEVTAAGTLVVVAAGNESGTPRRPADCKGVLTVGSVQANGQKADYSNFGSAVGISAPGGTGVAGASTNIWSTTNLGTTGPGSNDYGYKRGTSFSTPLAAGVASLMLAINPALTPSQLIARIRSGARPHVAVGAAPTCGAASGVCNCTSSTCGAGLLDADGATALAYNPVPVIASVGSPGPGAVITLDGRASSALSGSSLVSYQWTQVAGSALSIGSANTALASVTLPATPGEFRFRLVVIDSAARSAEEFLAVSTVPVDTAGGSTSSGGGGGGGATGWLWGAALWLVALWAWRRRRHGG
jgi:serine protease